MRYSIEDKLIAWVTGMIVFILIMLGVILYQAIEIERREADIAALKSRADSTCYLVVGMMSRQDSLEIVLALQPIMPVTIIDVSDWEVVE